MTDELQKRHMQAWGRATQRARHCFELQRQGRNTDDPALLAARETLLTELVELMKLSQDLDNNGPAWRRGDIYMTGAKGMLASCGVSMQEIEAYRSRLVDDDSTGIS
ncbi:MAG: hypothetical protein ACRDIV_03025 [Ktedonobacteraceae bacterium]